MHKSIGATYSDKTRNRGFKYEHGRALCGQQVRGVNLHETDRSSVSGEMSIKLSLTYPDQDISWVSYFAATRQEPSDD